jgi:hypothetical protein
MHLFDGVFPPFRKKIRVLYSILTTKSDVYLFMVDKFTVLDTIYWTFFG